jgi:uncharacterized protein DUF6265
MRSAAFTHTLVLIALLCILCGPGVAQPKDVSLSDLAWMAGGWGMSKEGISIEERWTSPAGGMMLGVERTISKTKNRVVEFEFLRLEDRPSGIFYVAQPNGQPPTEFKLVHGSDSEAVFENRQHDFPKRITYRKDSADAITAAVDDGENPPKKKQEFHYRRVQ